MDLMLMASEERHLRKIEESRHERGRLLAEAMVLFRSMIDPKTPEITQEVNIEMATAWLKKYEADK